MMRTIVCWGLYWGPPTLGNCYLQVRGVVSHLAHSVYCLGSGLLQFGVISLEVCGRVMNKITHMLLHR